MTTAIKKILTGNGLRAILNPI